MVTKSGEAVNSSNTKIQASSLPLKEVGILLPPECQNVPVLFLPQSWLKCWHSALVALEKQNGGGIPSSDCNFILLHILV